MSWHFAKMLHDGTCTDSMSSLSGASTDFQNLTEGAECVSGYLGCRICTRVSHHDNPQRVAPTEVAVGREYAEDAFGDQVGLIARGYDNPNRLDSRRRARHFMIRGGS